MRSFKLILYFILLSNGYSDQGITNFLPVEHDNQEIVDYQISMELEMAMPSEIIEGDGKTEKYDPSGPNHALIAVQAVQPKHSLLSLQFLKKYSLSKKNKNIQRHICFSKSQMDTPSIA